MTTKLPVILVDILQEVFQSISIPNVDPINYQPGWSEQILKSLQEQDNSVNFKSLKYPLGAVLLPIPEKRGTSVAYYATVRIPRIVFAQIISADGNDSVFDCYEPNGPLKSILYPIYYAFLQKLSEHKNVISGGPESFEHYKQDNPVLQPLGSGTNDFIVSIQIDNLELTLSQLKFC